MNKTMMFLQADLHRTINNGGSSLTISVLDLKELLSVVASAEGREKAEKCGHIFGWIRKDQLKRMREGQTLYCSLRRKKNEEYCDPVYCDPIGEKTVDVVAHIENTDATALAD